jgi:hypothetical protein
MVEGTLHNMVILHNKGILHNKVVIHQLGTLHNKVILLVVTLHNKGTHLLVILVHLVIMLQGLMEGLMDTAVWDQCLLGVQQLLPLLMVLTISPTAPMVLRAIIHRVAIHKVATLMAAMHMVVVTWVMENSSSMASSKGESMASSKGESLASTVEASMDSRSGSNECICNYDSIYSCLMLATL